MMLSSSKNFAHDCTYFRHLMMIIIRKYFPKSSGMQDPKPLSAGRNNTKKSRKLNQLYGKTVVRRECYIS